MTRVFVDSSVLIAASFSATGASREIMRQAIRGRITLVISNLVLEETEKNLARKATEALPAFRRFLDLVPFEIVRPTRQQVLDAAQYTAIKDAPIVAAAKKARVNYLVSLRSPSPGGGGRGSSRVGVANCASSETVGGNAEVATCDAIGGSGSLLPRLELSNWGKKRSQGAFRFGSIVTS